MGKQRRFPAPDSAWGRSSTRTRVVMVALVFAAVIGLLLDLLTTVRWGGIITGLAVLTLAVTSLLINHPNR